MDEPSLQERFAPQSTCFGCGPANHSGMRIGSHEGSHGELIAEWQPQPHHAAFTNILNGGVIGTLLDCHANWTATSHLMRARGAASPPTTVTLDYAVRFRRPTPSGEPVRLSARVVESAEDRATVEATLESGGEITATCRGTFVAVRPDHPAYNRW